MRLGGNVGGAGFVGLFEGIIIRGLGPAVIHYCPFRAVVLLWSFVVCFWCQSLCDISP